jgi:hypothetical protein
MSRRAPAAPLLRGRVLWFAADLFDRVDPVVRAGSWERADCRAHEPARHASDDEMDAATWCRHLVPDGSVYAFLADHRHQLFPPELFAGPEGIIVALAEQLS